MDALKLANLVLFLSTLSLRRATFGLCEGVFLLRNFYPRSPYGERLRYDNYNLHCVEISIHALLTESDNTSIAGRITSNDFYPRSPYGERHQLYDTYAKVLRVFLSTLSLRRATADSVSKWTAT